MSRILVIGYRQGLVQALEKRRIAFLLWTGKELKNSLPSRQLLKIPWPDTPKQFAEILPQILKKGPFTAILGGTERSIPLVAALRRACDLEQTKALNLLRCHDKLLMKNHLRDHEIPLNPYLWGPRWDEARIWQNLGPKIVCKDRSESGGRSMQIYTRQSELAQEMDKKQRLFESFNPHPEFSVESFIQNGEILFTNLTQYYLRRHINLLPASLPEQDLQKVLQLNEKVIRSLDLRQGMTHLEIYLGPDGPIVGEIAIRPPGGYIMELLDLAYGISSWNCFIDLEMGQACPIPKSPMRFAAAHVLHPGPGIVQAIKGWPAVRRHPSVKKAKLKVVVGDSIRIRLGVGEDVGYVLQAAPSSSALIAAVEEIRQLLHWTMDETDD